MHKQTHGVRKPSRDFPDFDQYKEDGVIYFSLKTAKEYMPKEYGKKEDAKHDKHSLFYSDLKALEKSGFIKKLYSGKSQRTKNIWKLLGDWKYK